MKTAKLPLGAKVRAAFPSYLSKTTAIATVVGVESQDSVNVTAAEWAARSPALSGEKVGQNE